MAAEVGSRPWLADWPLPPSALRHLSSGRRSLIAASGPITSTPVRVADGALLIFVRNNSHEPLDLVEAEIELDGSYPH
jgi:hypothetical protein